MSYLPSSPFRLTIAVWQSKMKDLFQVVMVTTTGCEHFQWWIQCAILGQWMSFIYHYSWVFMFQKYSALKKYNLKKKIKAIYVALDHFWSFRCSNIKIVCLGEARMTFWDY